MLGLLYVFGVKVTTDRNIMAHGKTVCEDEAVAYYKNCRNNRGKEFNHNNCKAVSLLAQQQLAGVNRDKFQSDCATKTSFDEGLCWNFFINAKDNLANAPCNKK